MKHSKNLILTDIDGVLLNWGVAFNAWASMLGYKAKNDAICIFEKYALTKTEGLSLIEAFHKTSEASQLTPVYNSEQVVKSLAKNGWRFVAISSVDESFRPGRVENLQRIFGDIFNEVHCVGTLGDKKAILEGYKDQASCWIDDMFSNVKVGHELGLKSFWMSDDSQASVVVAGIVKINCWSTISS